MVLIISNTGIQHRLTSAQNNCLGDHRVGDPSARNFLRGAHSARIHTVPKHHKVGSEPEMDPKALLGSSTLFHNLRPPEHGGLHLRGYRSEEHH